MFNGLECSRDSLGETGHKMSLTIIWPQEASTLIGVSVETNRFGVFKVAVCCFSGPDSV